jgi:hypothetical protein
MKRPIVLYLLCLLLAILSLNGLVAGMLMLIRPDGSLLQLNTEWLAGSPFASYLLPGFLLFLCIGFLPLLSLIGLLVRPSWSWPNALNIYQGQSWGWTYTLFSGIGTMIWIIVQQFMTRYFILQPIILSLGLAIVILALMPPVMQWDQSHTKTNGVINQ